LITASIMSKKLAESLSALVLDVKFGSGAFMKTLPEARTLARSLVQVGRPMGLRTSALLTDMSQPLGRMVGNAVEINEAIDALSGRGPADLVTLVLALGSQLLQLSGTAASADAAEQSLEEHLGSGRALEKFREMVRAQGGDLDAPRPVAPAWEIEAPHAGYVCQINAELFGLAIIAMGGGRRVITDSIDHSVGIETLVRIGQPVDRAQPMLHVFSPNETADRVRGVLAGAIQIGPAAPEPLPLIADRITAEM
jgi:thymidine phosphorylase